MNTPQQQVAVISAQHPHQPYMVLMPIEIGPTTVTLKEHLEKMLGAERQLRESRQESVKLATEYLAYETQRIAENAASKREHKARSTISVIIACVSAFGAIVVALLHFFGH